MSRSRGSPAAASSAHSRGRVLRAVVDDDHLELRVVAGERGADRVRDGRLLVVRRDEHADQRVRLGERRLPAQRASPRSPAARRTARGRSPGRCRRRRSTRPRAAPSGRGRRPGGRRAPSSARPGVSSGIVAARGCPSSSETDTSLKPSARSPSMIAGSASTVPVRSPPPSCSSTMFPAPRRASASTRRASSAGGGRRASARLAPVVRVDARADDQVAHRLRHRQQRHLLRRPRAGGRCRRAGGTAACARRSATRTGAR